MQQLVVVKKKKHQRCERKNFFKDKKLLPERKINKMLMLKKNRKSHYVLYDECDIEINKGTGVGSWGGGPRDKLVREKKQGGGS